MTLRHILFPYDFSPQGRQAAAFVRALAERSHARVTLLGVVPPSFESIPAGMDQDLRSGDDSEAWTRHLQARLDTTFVDEFARVPTTRIALAGDPALRITHYAKAHDVDLIMMPTHGLGRYRTLLVGSTTAKVLHDAACAVWTAEHADTQRAPVMAQRVLCALDGSEHAEPLAKWALAFCSRIGATLNLMHVVERVSDWPSLNAEQRLEDTLRDHARQSLESRLQAAGINAPLRVAAGGIAEAVAEEARQERAELVIVGRGSIGEPFGRFRTHATGIIHRAPCPVISV